MHNAFATGPSDFIEARLSFADDVSTDAVMRYDVCHWFHMFLAFWIALLSCADSRVPVPQWSSAACRALSMSRRASMSGRLVSLRRNIGF
jgi:hypothetical protein